MNCKEIESKLFDFIDGNLSIKENTAFKNHLESCTSCKKELEEARQFFGVLAEDTKDMPSDTLKTNFDKMLADEKKNQQAKVIPIQKESTNWKFFLRIAASILIVISAFLIGKYQSNIKPVSANNQQEVQQKENILALLKDNSASTRIMAVNKTEKIEKPDKKIIQALINRLFFDKNTNVRSAAAEALSKFTKEEMVKIALIKALETEKSSSIQIELIRILTEIQEKRAVKPMQELLKNEEIPLFVKQQVTQNLPNLL